MSAPGVKAALGVWLLAVSPASPQALRAPAETARHLQLRLGAGPADYPGATAVVLLDEVSKSIDPQRQQTITRHHMVKVLRGRGEDQAFVRLLLPGETNLQIAARTVTAAGKLVPLQGSDFHHEKIRSSDPLAGATREVVSFTFPAVGAGAILEYSYQVTVEHEMLADVHLFDGELPVQLARYVLGHPQDETYKVWAEDPRSGRAIAGARTAGSDLRGRGQMLEVYDVRDLPATPGEARALGGLRERARLFVVNTRTTISMYGSEPWDRLAVSLHRMQEGRMIQLEKQRLRAFAATRAAESPKDKTLAVLRYLQARLRIETQQEVSGASRTIEEILASGVVEPTEFCILLAGLLREAGLPAYLGMVNSSDSLDLDPRVPWSGFFDRMLVAVFLKDRTLYFDPLSPDIAGGWPRADCQGRKMLVARQSGSQRMSQLPAAKAEFLDIPFMPPEDNAIERATRARLGSDGSATLHLEQTFAGEHAWELGDRIRTLGRDLPRAEEAAALLRLVPDGDPARVSLDVTARSARVTADFTTRTWLVESAGGPALNLSRLSAPPVLDGLAPLLLGERQSGVDLGAPQRFRSVTAIDLPPGASVRVLPAAVHADGPGMRYSSAVRRTPGGLERSSTLTVSDAAVEPSDLPALKVFLRQVARAEESAIPIRLPGGK